MTLFLTEKKYENMALSMCIGPSDSVCEWHSY